MTTIILNTLFGPCVEPLVRYPLKDFEPIAHFRNVDFDAQIHRNLINVNSDDTI